MTQIEFGYLIFEIKTDDLWWDYIIPIISCRHMGILGDGFIKEVAH